MTVDITHYKTSTSFHYHKGVTITAASTSWGGALKIADNGDYATDNTWSKQSVFILHVESKDARLSKGFTWKDQTSKPSIHTLRTSINSALQLNSAWRAYLSTAFALRQVKARTTMMSTLAPTTHCNTKNLLSYWLRSLLGRSLRKTNRAASPSSHTTQLT